MSRSSLCLLITFLLTTPYTAMAAENDSKTLITVYDFQGGDDISSDLVATVSARLRQNITSLKDYKLVDTSNMGVLELDQIAIGKINKTAEKDFTLIIEILDPNDTVLIQSYVEVCPSCDLNDILLLVDLAADALFRKGKAKAGGKQKQLIRQPTMPPLPKKLENFLPEAGSKVLAARESALAADKRGKEASDAAVRAWVRLARIGQDNPYRSDAAKRSRDWYQYSADAKIWEKQRQEDAAKLKQILKLSSVSLQEKREALSDYGKRFGGKDALDVLKRMDLHPEVIKELNSSPVTVISSPTGASVTVDGYEEGVTPWEGTIPSGVRELELVVDGYHPAKRKIVVLPELANSHSFELRPLSSSYQWIFAHWSYPLIQPKLGGRSVSRSQGNGSPSDLTLTGTNDVVATGVPASIVIEAGMSPYVVGYRYSRFSFPGHAFDELSTSQGLYVVSEGTLQEHALRGGWSYFWGKLPVIRAYGVAELGLTFADAGVAGNTESSIYSSTSPSAGLLAGAEVVYNIFSLTLETGAQFNETVRPEFRLMIGTGYFEHRYE